MVLGQATTGLQGWSQALELVAYVFSVALFFAVDLACAMFTLIQLVQQALVAAHQQKYCAALVGCLVLAMFSSRLTTKRALE